MMRKDIIIMSQEELKRSHMVKKVLAKELKQMEVANMLELSDRQVRRVVKRFREEGDVGIVHRLRGKLSNRAIERKVKDKVVRLYRSKYHDFGPTLANEKLFELDKIKIGIQTLRNWLIAEGIWQVKARRDKHRQWRERKHHFGEMVQVDGSHHDWFEERGPECVLMGYIDDATNKVYARFYKYEGTLPAMDSFKRYLRKYGLPHSIYIDKHTTYKSNAKLSIEDELNNREPLSQFGRALKELGIDVIYANSPQAKGRVEKLFRTFQDRVIKEMRLKDIKSIREANKFLKDYLPVFNKRFSIDPMERGNFHRPLSKDIDIDGVLSIKTERSLKNDFTIAHDRKLYQILDHVNTLKVTVQERTDGRMFITYKGRRLKYGEIAQRPAKPKSKCVFKLRKVYIPPADHPWRSFSVSAKAKRKVLVKI